MSETPNSQTRRSSNLEVRIPQATTSSEEVTEQEASLNKENTQNETGEKSLKGENAESATNDGEVLNKPDASAPELPKQEASNAKQDAVGTDDVKPTNNNQEGTEQVGQEQSHINENQVTDDKPSESLTEVNPSQNNNLESNGLQEENLAKNEGDEARVDIKEEKIESNDPSQLEKSGNVQQSEEVDQESQETKTSENKDQGLQQEVQQMSEKGEDLHRDQDQPPDIHNAEVTSMESINQQQVPVASAGSVKDSQELSDTEEKVTESTNQQQVPVASTGSVKDSQELSDTEKKVTENQIHANNNNTDPRIEDGEQQTKADQEERLQESTTEQTNKNHTEDARTASRMSQRESRRSSAASSRNLEAMQAALDTRKESGTGFILSSQFEDGEKESDGDEILQRELPEGLEDSADTKPKMATSTVRFQTGVTADNSDNTYITETPHRESFLDGRESRESHVYSPAYIDTGGRRSPDGGLQSMKIRKKKEKIDPKRAQILQRLNLPKPPTKYHLNLRPLKPDPDPNNKAPLNPNIYYAEVPKEGGRVKTPFYLHVDIPNDALDGKVRLKFERQEFDRMKLGLTDDDTLCSCIVDLNMEPMTYCLRKNATLKMRILDKCINKYEETIIITARHFLWHRIPTRIESKTINGEKHYYAVTKSQSFGKFAVINTKKMDRFIITNAGGDFRSTIVPEIQLHIDEHHLSNHSPQMVEMLIRKTKDEAIKQVQKEMPNVKGAGGTLVATSPIIEISKDLMAQTGKMKHGIRFPDKLMLHIPVPEVATTSGTRSAVIMQKHTNPHYNTINGHRYHPNAYSKNEAHLWKDITESNRLSADGVSFLPNEAMNIKVSGPGKFMVLVFEENGTKSGDAEFDLDDLSNAIVETNHEHEMHIMVHQKVDEPSVISIHAVTSDAVEPICETMRGTKLWKKVYVSKKMIMREWQPIKLEFKGDIQMTINQMNPQLRFYSRRWQGYQIQLEATDEAYKAVSEKYVGKISFLEEGKRAIRKTKSTISVESEDDPQELCNVDIEIARDHARPYHPTVVIKEVPKVPIYREYKMKWLSNLSEEEIERYRAAHGI